MKSRIFFVFLLLNVLVQAGAQPFASEIAAFKKRDSISFPAKNAILFVGSSSFRMWKDVQEDFPGHTIINRGFGGSSLPDMIRYVGEIIYPYKAKQILIYCGENDFAAEADLQPEQLLERFKQLFQLIRKKDKKVVVGYVSMKPSPSRRHLWNKFKDANAMIKSFLQAEKRTQYIDVYEPMLTEKGEPVPGIFLEDNLHMNNKGYAIWQKIIEPYLLK
jgi:lysophospholipase L1-like esterase